MSDIERFDANAISNLPPSFQSQTPIDYAAIHSALINEHDYRAEKASWARLDLHQSIPLGAASLVVAEVQKEMAARPDVLQASDHAEMVKAGWLNAPFEHLASLPVSWQGVALGVGTFTLVNTASHLRSFLRFPRDVNRTVQQINNADAFIPQTSAQRSGRRLMNKAARGLVAAATSFSAYKIGEHVTIEQDTIATAGTIVAAYGTVAVSGIRTRFVERRATRATAQSRLRSITELE